MIDFSLTPADRRLVEMARREAAAMRKHARNYDQNEHQIEPEAFPEAAELPDKLAVLRDIEGETSGRIIAESLIHLEYSDPRIRRNKTGLGDKIVGYSGTPQQLERFAGKTLSIAMTEPGAGSDPQAIIGSARYDAATDEWVLNGEKIYCSQFGSADGALVLLKGPPDGNGVRPFMAFVVEKGTPGMVLLGQVKKMGIRNWDTEDFVLQDCRVPAINKIDADFKKTMVVFNGTRPMIAAYALSIARTLLDFTREKLAEAGLAVDYKAGHNGRSLQQDRLVRLEAMHDAAMLSVLHCKWSEQREGTTTGATKVEAAMAKAMGGMAARKITQGCMEMLGPLGISEAFLAEKWFRDARIFDIFEGAGEINRLIVARWLLGYSQKELN
jgi:acyl-CoA dehydrogenase